MMQFLSSSLSFLFRRCTGCQFVCRAPPPFSAICKCNIHSAISAAWLESNFFVAHQNTPTHSFDSSSAHYAPYGRLSDT